jgi:hypothetical protein
MTTLRLRWRLCAALILQSVLSVALPSLAAEKPRGGSGSHSAAGLIGTWALVSIEERNAKGERVTPLDYGPEPVGLLIYDATGHMSAQAMRRGRPRLGSDDVHRATPAGAKTALVGYNAYFGKYEVDEAKGIVVHVVEGSLIPDWEGSRQVRRFTLAGDRLVLEPPTFRAAGEQRTRRLTWQRVRQAGVGN